MGVVLYAGGIVSSSSSTSSPADKALNLFKSLCSSPECGYVRKVSWDHSRQSPGKQWHRVILGRKDRRYNNNKQVMAGEEWVLQFLSLLCGQTNVASGLNLSNWVCPLAEVWESLKERAKWLNGSGESALSLMGFTHSAPSGWSRGASALAALNCSWLQVPHAGGAALLPALLGQGTGKGGRTGQGVARRQKSEEGVMHAEKQNQSRNTELSYFASWCCMWLHACLERYFMARAFTTTIGFKEFSGLSQKLHLSFRGKGMCVWFGSFLFKPFVLPVSNLPGKINR